MGDGARGALGPGRSTTPRLLGAKHVRGPNETVLNERRFRVSLLTPPKGVCCMRQDRQCSNEKRYDPI